MVMADNWLKPKKDGQRKKRMGSGRLATIKLEYVRDSIRVKLQVRFSPTGPHGRMRHIRPVRD